MALYSIDQCMDNAKILHETNVIFTCDNDGNLSYISKYNLLGRLVNFLKNIIEGSGEYKVNQVILATLNQISQYAEEHPEQPEWRYRDVSIKPFLVGVDKVAMRILIDNSRFAEHGFFTSYHPSRGEIREAAYKVLLMGLEQREKEKIGFDSRLG